MTWAVSVYISFENAHQEALQAAEEELEERGLSWYSAGTCYVGFGSRDIQWRFRSRKAAEVAANLVKEVLLWHGIEHDFSLEKV